MTNTEISNQLRLRANDLARAGENLYRIRALRRAAITVQRWPEPLESAIEREGAEALERIPGIGSHLAATIAGMRSGPMLLPGTSSCG